MNQLDQLRQVTTVVADTGDIGAIRQYQPVDATTNPSLLFKVAADNQYRSFLNEAITAGKGDAVDIADYLAVAIGTEILSIIPGRVSTEVSASLSFNTQATIDKARRLIELYSQKGISPDRVLIKIAATWEGIKAAEILEKEGIQCNLTLLFSFTQAVACADAGVFLISPFVGRIYDWFKAKTGEEYHGADDPGVQSVSRIYHYYKAYSYDTVVMGASFRNIGQIQALSGCDRLTISPQLLDELSQNNNQISAALAADNVSTADPRLLRDETGFRWELNEDAMATEKLAEGIRKFYEDERKLYQLIAQYS